MSSTKAGASFTNKSEEETMIHTLQDYIQRLQGLQDKRQTPHKPFLLLIIMEMLGGGELSENRIPFREIEEQKSFFTDLVAVFNSGNTKNWHPSLYNTGILKSRSQLL